MNDIPAITARPTRLRPLSFSMYDVDNGTGNSYPVIIYGGIEYRLHNTDSEYCEAVYYMSVLFSEENQR
jgi:hypothetical protein